MKLPSVSRSAAMRLISDNILVLDSSYSCWTHTHDQDHFGRLFVFFSATIQIQSFRLFKSRKAKSPHVWTDKIVKLLC